VRREHEVDHDRMSTAELAGAGEETPTRPTDDVGADDRREDRRDDISDGGLDTRERHTVDADRPASATEPMRDDGKDQDEGAGAPLLDDQRAASYRSRWESIQTGFVDKPRDSVRDADSLVAELMRDLAESFSRARSDLEGQWDRGDDVSTEDLRVTLQRYRSFFNRLLEA
jgi:hypothetical protein